VEGYFLDKGVILPSFHKVYFNGLTTGQWPRFSWVDPAVPALSSKGAHMTCRSGLPSRANQHSSSSSRGSAG
jgi:hypothetical protein